MVGKNNKFLKENKNNQRFLRFSLRKLSVGVVSVAIAAGFYIGGSQSVLADTVSTAPVVSQGTSNDNSAENADKNTVSLQNSSASADSSAVASAVDSTAAEAVKSAVPAASSAAEQQKTATFNVAEAKPAAASNTANLLDNKAQSNAASDAAENENDQLLQNMNIKTSDPTDNKAFNKYQGLVNAQNKETTDTSSQYVFSVIRDNRINTDFVWTINRSDGKDEAISIYAFDSDSKYYEDHRLIPSDGKNFYFSSKNKKFYFSSDYDYRHLHSEDDVVLNYTPSQDEQIGSVDISDDKIFSYFAGYDFFGHKRIVKDFSLNLIYGMGSPVTAGSYASSIAEILPQKGQPIVKFLLWTSKTERPTELRTISYSKGLTGRKFEIDTENYNVKDAFKDAFRDKGLELIGIRASKIGTFTQFGQGLTYVKHYVNNDLVIKYHQDDAVGTMSGTYSYKDFYGRVHKGSFKNLSAGETEPISGKGINITIRNPYVAGNYAYEFIYAPYNDLHKTMTRTINVTEPGQATKTTKQFAKIFRDATVDEVTGEVTYGDWSTDTTGWAEFAAPVHAGYTASQSKVDAVTVADGQKDVTVNITYTANNQAGKISYVDPNGQEVANTGLAGKTGDIINVIPQAPVDWKIVEGQTLPKTVVAGTDGIPTVTVKVTHDTITVTPDQPKNPSDKLPDGKNYPSGVTKDDLNKTISRKITINVPKKPDQVINQEADFTRTATIDLVNHDVTYGDWTLAHNTLTDINVPVVPGYTPSQDTIDGIATPTVDTPLSDITVNYKADEQKGRIAYVDEKGNQISSTPLSGKTDQDVDVKGKINVPTNWKIVPGQNIPDTVKATADGIPTVTINIEHDTITVNPDDPKKPSDKLPDGTNYPAGVDQNDLNHDVVRTINITKPGEATTTTTQKTSFNRTATIDLVDHSIKYGNWVQQGNNGWKKINVPAVDGYTPSVQNIDEVAVTPDTKDATINVTYTANDQTGAITYIDRDGNTIDTTPLTGKTNESIAINPVAPEGWKIVAGQQIPTTVKATANGIQGPFILVEHDTTTVKPGDLPNPGDKKSGNPDKKPGDKTPKTDITYNDLHKAMTRTINVTDPHTGLKTTKVTLHYERTATIDDVTGEVTYGNWTVAEGSKAGFDDFDVPAVAGYTSEIESGSATDLKALTPSQDQITNWTDQTVDIDYTANDQSMKITYVDRDGNPVDGGIFSVSGKTDQTVNTNAKVPAGWVLVKGQQDAPATITFTGTPTKDITIKIEHGKTSVDHNHPLKPGDKTPSGKEIKGAHNEDLNQTITRTINITEPGQSTKTTTQVAHIYRDATVDDVTGEVTYGAWSTDSAEWAAVNVPSHAGYTAHQSDGQTGIPAVTVKDGHKDVTIDVTYTPDDQKGQITYVDEKGNQISSTPLTGKTDEDVAINPVAPAGWKIVAGQQIPTTVKATANGIEGPSILVEHDTTTVKSGDLPNPGDKKPGNPDKRPGDKTPNTDITYNDLHKTATRTIIIHDPHNGDTVDRETISFNRSATIDDVTGDVTYGAWTVASDSAQDHFKKVDYPAVPGYTLSATPGEHGEQTLTQDQINSWVDPQIEVSYAPVAQTGKVSYVDPNGQEVAHTDLTGETDQNVDVKANVPTNWELVPGQTIPDTVKATADGIPTVTVKVQPKIDSITDPAKLNKSISRTITINKPGEKSQVINQHADFTRTGQHNEVTGEDVYTDWMLKDSNLEAVDAPAVPGYTPNVAHVDSVENPTADTKLANVVINYSANDQTQKIDYVDPNGKIVKTDTITGKTDETVKVTPSVPDHYELVPGQDIPGEVKVTDNNPVITVKVTPKLDPVTDPSQLTKTITRIINVTNPDGQKVTNKQVATFTRTGETNEVTGETAFTNWQMTANGWTKYTTPAIKGYTPTVKDVPAVNVTPDMKDAEVNITYIANESSQVINYVDPDGNVVKTDEVPGKTDETVKITPSVPDHYELVPGQEIPDEVKITDDTPAITVKVTPKMDPVTDQAKLTKTISRKITINKPGEKPQVINQTATFKRTGKTNEVTGITTYTPWGLDQNGLTTVSAPEVPGYAPSQKTVVAIDNPTVNTKLTDVMITYTANSQTTHINYVDKDGKTVKSDMVSGKTDETVKTNSEVPAGWKITDGQVPETIRFTGEETPDTTVTIEHDTTSVDHTKPVKPGDKTPSGKVIDGAHEDDLNQTITRMINVTTPDGQTTTTTQVAKLFRDATIDDVTGEVTYGSWSEDTWADFRPGQLAGYTASQADVPAVTVKDGQKDQTVDITYTANEGTVQIKYVDKDGNEIGRQVITGHVGDTIKVTPQFPENWVPVDPDTVPAEVQIKEENGQIIIVVVRHAEKDPVQTKNVTRTITVTTPDGQTKTITQVATISRHGDLDLVTGQIAWQPWTTAQWDVFKPAVIAGYIPSLAEVPAVTVDGETTDQTVDITYAAVAAQPERQAPTASDTTDAQQATKQKADSNAQPAVTAAPSQQLAVAQQAESTANSRRLPQTGNSHDASALAGLGLASLMGLFGLGGKRRKRD